MIKVRNLTCIYDDVVAVRGIDFDVAPGEIFGFIGPNGAGKTTTIRTLATLFQPQGGTARIAGLDVVGDYAEVRKLLGYMPDYFGIYDDLKVWEYLDFFARAHQVDSRKRRQVVDDVLVLTDLTNRADFLVEELSKGLKQRLCLAKTLVHDPQVLLLDEPASGLDPRARIEMRELFRELKSMGKTLLISSHILPELKDLCDRVGIIQEGRIVSVGRVRDLVGAIKRPHAVVHLAGNPELFHEPLMGIPGILEVADHEDGVRITLEEQDPDLTSLIRHIVEAGLPLTGFIRESSDLEDVFMDVTGG